MLKVVGSRIERDSYAWYFSVDNEKFQAQNDGVFEVGRVGKVGKAPLRQGYVGHVDQVDQEIGCRDDIFLIPDTRYQILTINF